VGIGQCALLVVKINTSTQALTVDELQGHTKTVLINMLDTIHNSVTRNLDHVVASPEFQAGLEQDKEKTFDSMSIRSIKRESAKRVKVYKDKDDMWFADSTNVGKTVTQGLVLPLLARGKVDLWLRDPQLTYWNVGGKKNSVGYHDFQHAHSKALARRRRELAEAEANGDDGAVVKLTLEDCVDRGWIPGEDALEAPDEFSGETSLWTRRETCCQTPTPGQG
jgi:hypothetical protein